MNRIKSISPLLLAVITAVLFSFTATDASAQWASGEVAEGEWALATVTETAGEWRDLNYVEQVASATSQDMVNLGNGWYWSITGYYFYVQTPYIYNETVGVWLYTLSDDSGIYFYNFIGTQWDWWDRNGQAQVQLTQPLM